MNVLNRMMSYDKSNKKLNINETKKVCNCAECSDKSLNFLPKQYEEFDNFPLTENQIQTIINLHYWYKDKKTKTFIWKALHVHGNKYIYHKTVYTKVKDSVKIDCRNKGHSTFNQNPNNHLRGCGCSICAKISKYTKQRLTTEEFIIRAKEIHGDKYDYSKVKYVNAKTKIIIICHNHDEPYEFEQLPYNHLRGIGCQLCANEKKSKEYKLTLEEFINLARKIHGNKYDYSKVVYIDSHTEVEIICHKHGSFKQRPDVHLSGYGCSKCHSSKGEITIRTFLINHNIDFEEQKRFDNCKYKRKLPFDFYIPQYKLCIEFDGLQHFYIGGYYKSKEKNLEKLKLTQLRDQIKNDYCKNNRINLLRIRYDENIEEKLIEYFSKI